MTDVESVVIVDEIKTSSNDYTIGRLTLNKPKALNALDLEMAGIMLDALQRWQSRNDIVAVVKPEGSLFFVKSVGRPDFFRQCLLIF